MKYLRGFLGTGPAFQGLRSANIRFRTFRSSKVTYCSSHTGSTVNAYRFCPRRYVSTGPRKSQMAVVGTPPKTSVMLPNPVEINKFISSVPGKHRSKRSRFPVSPPKLPQNIPPRITYGEFLTTSSSCSKNIFMDPFVIESAFLPTFHKFQEEFHCIFGHEPILNADSKTSSPTKPSEDNVPDHSERPYSWDEKSWGSPDIGTSQCPDTVKREVKKEIVLPRDLKHLSSHERLQIFVDVHRFDETDAKNDAEKKDIGGFPHGGDHTTLPTGQFIIHSDRSSYIINKDLYITNRILDKLKKRDNESPTDGRDGEPIVKASSVTKDPRDTKQMPQLQDEVANYQKLHPKRPVEALPEYTLRPAHKSKSDTSFLSSAWTYLNPEPVTKKPIPDDIHLADDALHEQQISKCYSGSSMPTKEVSHEEDSIAPVELPSNVEFSNPPSERLSPLEFRAFESRKNLYKKLVRNTPCYLVDGLHIENASVKNSNGSPELPEDSFNKGDSVEISHTAARLPGEANETVPWELPVRSNDKDLNKWENDVVSEQNAGDLEEWFVPLGNEIDSMLTTLSVAKSNNCSELDAEPTLNQGSQKQVEVHEDFMEFKDCVDHIGDSEIFDVAGAHLEKRVIPFEGLENFENSLVKSNPELHTPGTGRDFETALAKSNPELHTPGTGRDFETALAKSNPELHTPGTGRDFETALAKSNHELRTPGSGRVRFNSSSTNQKTPIPPKQNNPNVDIKTETTIKCCRSGNNTDINVIETQRYLDKRLPYPFSTETVLQVYGTNDSLHKATQAVENSKSQLVHLSNANTPNPGMVIPKLQFNHMLSKTHEITNQNSNNKKRVFKIKIVPESGSQYSAPPNVSSSEPSSVSQVLHAPKQPSSDVNREALDLPKKSKYPHKTTSKKMRRSESARQLRSRKKHSNDDIGENITVLSPKDLERMFPTPPKPKPVEKPRNVTVNNQAANTDLDYNALNLVEATKAISKITLKAKNKKDKWFLVKKKAGPSKSGDFEANDNITQASVKVEKELSAKKLGKNDREAGLSPRDQKILKSIISHKVKDSFTAVSQREKNIKDNTARATNDRPVGKSSITVGQQLKSTDNRMHQRVADKAVLSKGSSSPTSEAKAKLSENLFKGSENLMPPPTKYEELKVAKEPDVIKKPRPLDDSPLGLVVGREQVSDTAGKMNTRVVPVSGEGEKPSTRFVSPTPIHNREYRTVNIVDRVRSSGVSTKPQTPKPPKSPTQKFSEGYGSERADGKKPKVIRPIMGSILPLSPKVIVENITKSTPDIKDAPSRDNPSRPKSAFSEIKRMARSNSERFSHSHKPDFNSTRGNAKSKFTKTSKSEVQDMLHVGKDVQQPNKWQPPMFFPFETPTVKELEQRISTPQGEFLPISPSSSDPQVYETDFCKLSAESNPGLDVFSQATCKVPLSRVKEFPMVNESKTSYSAPNMAISIKPNTDVMLRRTLSQMPAVTKVLGATLSAKSQQALDRWKQGLVSTLGEEGYKQFVENQLREGSNFHSTVGKFLLNKMDCKDDLCMKSMSSVFPHITDIGVIESQVVHPQLAYRGVVDCVAKYKGKPVAIEWKRSDKSKPSIKHTYDAPLQLSAYIGALNFDNNYKLQVEGGMVVVAYSDGSPADVFEIPLEECQRYWSKWLKRLYQFYSRT